MKHRLRSAVLALWYTLRLDNPISFKDGFLYLKAYRVLASDTKNGILRIPMIKNSDGEEG